MVKNKSKNKSKKIVKTKPVAEPAADLSTLCEVEIKVMGKKYFSKGISVSEALNNLKVPGFTKALSVLSVKKGEQAKSRVLVPLQTARLFSPSKLMREVAIKNISMLF